MNPKAPQLRVSVRVAAWPGKQLLGLWSSGDRQFQVWGLGLQLLRGSWHLVTWVMNQVAIVIVT